MSSNLVILILSITTGVSTFWAITFSFLFIKEFKHSREILNYWRESFLTSCKNYDELLAFTNELVKKLNEQNKENKTQ